MYVNIEQVSADGLVRDLWQFSLVEHRHNSFKIKFAGYKLQSRPTKRHKFRTEDRYVLHGTSGEEFALMSDWRENTMSFAEVPLTVALFDEARKRLLDAIMIERPQEDDDRKRRSHRGEYSKRNRELYPQRYLRPYAVRNEFANEYVGGTENANTSVEGEGGE